MAPVRKGEGKIVGTSSGRGEDWWHQLGRGRRRLLAPVLTGEKTGGTSYEGEGKSVGTSSERGEDRWHQL